MTDSVPDLGETLSAWRAGKAEAEAVLNREVYALLKRMAGARLAHSGPVTLDVTGLVHEAVVRLLGGGSDWTSREHFFALVAMQMAASHRTPRMMPPAIRSTSSLPTSTTTAFATLASSIIQPVR